MSYTKLTVSRKTYEKFVQWRRQICDEGRGPTGSIKRLRVACDVVDKLFGDVGTQNSLEVNLLRLIDASLRTQKEVK